MYTFSSVKGLSSCWFISMVIVRARSVRAIEMLSVVGLDVVNKAAK